MYIYIDVCIHINKYMYIHKDIYIYTHIYTHMYIMSAHTYINVHISKAAISYPYEICTHGISHVMCVYI